jgi:transposase
VSHQRAIGPSAMADAAQFRVSVKFVNDTVLLKRATGSLEDEFRKDAVRIALSSKDQDLIRGIKFPEDGLTRKQIACDLGVGMLTRNKWITAHRDTDVVSAEDRELARENARLRRENRILKDLSRTRKQSGCEQKQLIRGIS